MIEHNRRFSFRSSVDFSVFFPRLFSSQLLSSFAGTLVVNINLMLIALLPSRKYQPHRDQLDGLGTKTLLMKKTRQALLCRLLLALQAAAHRRLARLQPWPRWLPILIRSFAIYGYESEGYIASWFENLLFKISGNWCCHSRNFLYFFLSCWPLWRRFFNHYHIGIIII